MFRLDFSAFEPFAELFDVVRPLFGLCYNGAFRGESAGYGLLFTDTFIPKTFFVERAHEIDRTFFEFGNFGKSELGPS